MTRSRSTRCGVLAIAVLAGCGGGTAAPDAGEVVPPDAAVVPDAIPAICGNQVVESGEGCDPGAADACCTAGCQIVPGCEVPLHDMGLNPHAVAVRHEWIYWSGWDTLDQIARTSIDGEITEVLLGNTVDLGGVAVGDRGVYFSRWQDVTIYRMDHAGSPPESVGSVLGGAGAIDVNREWIVGTPNPGGNAVLFLSLDTAEWRTEVLASGTDVFELAVDETTMYLAAGGSRILSLPVTGGVDPVAFAPATPAVSVAVDEAYVYWLDPDGAIYRKAKMAGVTELVGQYASAGSQIAVDDACIYIADRAQQRLKKVSKLPAPAAR